MNTRDTYGGAALVGFAGAYALAAGSLSMRSSLGIGPGLFPMVLAGILALIGVVVLVQGILSREGGQTGAPVPWRGIALIVAAPVVFGFAIEPLGLIPGLFASIFLAALANRGTTLLGAAGISAFMVVFCIMLFKWGLGLPLPLFGTLFNFAG
jgi:hypothetical protein